MTFRLFTKPPAGPAGHEDFRTCAEAMAAFDEADPQPGARLLLVEQMADGWSPVRAWPGGLESRAAAWALFLPA